MAINKIPQVTCGLNLGYIYNISYDYIPQEGIKISIYFVNDNGIFNVDSSILSPSNKTNITIGNASFNLYPIKYELLRSVERKVLRIDFVDETFKLENYYVVLLGRGCGENVYQLGQIVNTDLNIGNTFPDIEYYFTDFLNILRSKFPVNVLANFDDSLPKTFTGTFKSVLSEWCAYYNLAFFFENSVINIVDRATLDIEFPTNEDVTEALEFNVSESLENTYATTAFSYIQRPGKKIGLEGLIKYVTLFPIDNNSSVANDFDQVLNDISSSLNFGGSATTSSQYTVSNVNLLQVAAALLGQEYWFLYNYANGSLQECGWSSADVSIAAGDPTWAQIMGPNGVGAVGAKFAQLDEKVFNAKFQFYKEFGEKIAGRYYLSEARTDIDDERYRWFNNEDQNTSFISQQRVDVTFVSQGQNNSSPAFIPGTYINEYFQGISYLGNHIVYTDTINKSFSSIFSIPASIAQLIKGYFEALTGEGFTGAKSMDFTNLGIKYIIYKDQTLDQSIVQSFSSLSSYLPLFEPRYTSYSIKGTTQVSPTANFTPGGLAMVQANAIYTEYLELLRSDICNSQSSSDGSKAYKRNFINFSVSNDIETPAIANQISNSTYQTQIDLTNMLLYLATPILKALAAENDVPLKTVTFTLNYFYDVPISFISNGLTSMKLEVNENGISASYTYSNSMVQRIKSQAFIEELERSIRNSWIMPRSDITTQ